MADIGKLKAGLDVIARVSPRAMVRSMNGNITAVGVRTNQFTEADVKVLKDNDWERSEVYGDMWIHYD